MNDLYKWQYMVAFLRGAQFDQFTLEEVATQLSGPVLETHRHTLLSDRLYEPSSVERFAAI